jgi:hypothetical protein
LYPLVDIYADRLLQLQITNQLSGGAGPRIISSGLTLKPTLIQVLKAQEGSFLTTSWNFPVTGTPMMRLTITVFRRGFLHCCRIWLAQKALPTLKPLRYPIKTKVHKENVFQNK